MNKVTQVNESRDKRSSGQPWLVLFLLIVVVFAIAWMTTPIIMKANKHTPMTTATSNAKSLFYLLVEFDQDYGQFPGDETAQLYRNENGEVYMDLRAFKGKWSNDYLGQLIASDCTRSEEIFGAYENRSGFKKPDNVIDPSEKILEAGECGFAYYKGASTSYNSERPILMTPMSDDGLGFDSEPYNGKAVVLRIDGAVKQLLIDDKTGKAKVGDDKTLFEGGEGTAWGNAFNAANVVLPEPGR